MNTAFAQYTSNTAFALSLTHTQCNALLRLKQDGFLQGIVPFHQVATLAQLERRGLVWWGPDPENAERRGFRGLTKAGELTCDLLAEAGLSVASTNSQSVLRAMERRTA